MSLCCISASKCPSCGECAVYFSGCEKCGWIDPKFIEDEKRMATFFSKHKNNILKEIRLPNKG